MNVLPPDHPARLALSEEVHARPPQPLDTPCRVTHIAVLTAHEDRARERLHIADLCRHFRVTPPAEDTGYFCARLGAIRFTWERHGEFSGFTMMTPGCSPRPFTEPVTTLLPVGWLATLPGATIAAAHAELMPAEEPPMDAAALAAHFDGATVVGGPVSDGAGYAYTDFRIHADGFARFVVCDHHFTDGQAGRTVQRLFEIEAYRMLALLAFPLARELAPRMAAIEASLVMLTAQIAAEGGQDEALLHDLTRLAAEIEQGLSTSEFRFGACRAYHQLVTSRIQELRETRLPGVQPIGEFMARRLTPAVATCASTSLRLHGLSDRVAQASALLSTRVDIARAGQNQALLASMDRRAKLQLRLQQTVEGLSVAAIVYYVVGLIGYLAKAGKASGLVALQPDLWVGVSIPVVAGVVFLALRRARRALHRPDASGDEH